MKKNPRWRKSGIRAIAIVITCSMVVSLMTVLGGSASAGLSLDGIEYIKNSSKSLSILEIVPQEGTGSIGYYVGGREPTANWMSVLASKEGGADARDKYAEDLFAKLMAMKLMGDKSVDEDVYPLIYTGVHKVEDYGYYKEYLPWDTIPEGAVQVRLDKEETQQLTGSFIKDPTGDYIAVHTYILTKNGDSIVKNGDFVENPHHYEYGQGGSSYYYCLKFKRVHLTKENYTDYLNEPLYIPVENERIPGHTYYEYVGELTEVEDNEEIGAGDFTIQDEINDPVNGIGYWILDRENLPTEPDPSDKGAWEYLEEINFTEEPIENFLDKTLYVASTVRQGYYDAVQIKNASDINAEITYYKLVENAHAYHVVTDPEEETYKSVGKGNGFFTRTTAYQFEGNKNIADKDKCFRFSTTSGNTVQTLVYDTIYVSGGYRNSNWFKRYVLDMEKTDNLADVKINVTSVTPDKINEADLPKFDLVVISAGFDRDNNGSTIAYSRDISESVFNALKQKPRVVDSRISGASRLASLLDGTTSPSVTANNVYNFAEDDVRGALATNQFHTKFNTTTPYQVVVNEIKHENFLRGDQDQLSLDVSMATCIRYLLNPHRPENKKTTLNVLDIQPNAKKYTNDNTLTQATVLSWLPQTTGASPQIKITHMSTAELICNIEDLSEKYDLIYIGASQVGNNLPDGMYYANIGKEQQIDPHLRGLLDSNEDYARYSGNDLTPTKRNELWDYAGYINETTRRAGLPIVVSDTLLKSTTVPKRTLTASISSKGDQLEVKYQLNPSVTPASVTYEWYKYTTNADSAILVQNGGTTYVPSEPSDAGDYYYCRVTVTINNVTRVVQSNTLRYEYVAVPSNVALDKVGSNHPYYNWENKTATGPDFSGTISSNNGTLTVSEIHSDDPNNFRQDPDSDLTYNWKNYDTGESVKTGSGNNYKSYSPTVDGTYYCEITIPYEKKEGYWIFATWEDQSPPVTITSPAYTATVTEGTPNLSFSPAGEAATSAEFPSVSTFTVDPTKVDGYSLMYDMLTEVWDYPNVFVQSEVQRKTSNNPDGLANNQDTLVSHLNLSRPEIVFAASSDSTPPEYAGIGSVNNNCGGDLDFKFSIQNATDPTPLETRYTCNLYIDQNGDGRHSKFDDDEQNVDGRNNKIDERIGGLLLYDSTTGTPVENGELVAGTTYELHRKIGTQFTGGVAWKLEVVKVVDDDTEYASHASQKGYTFNPPDSSNITKINVLQIRPESGIGVDLKSKNNPEKLFTDLYDAVKNVGIQINVDSTSADALNADPDVSGTLSHYNMIIIGFYDCYKELDFETTQAISDYIDTGRAVLFTHDNTSFYNETWEEVKHRRDYERLNVYEYWGYYFNQLIRDKVGLDRYGVSNPNYGKEIPAPDEANQSITYHTVASGTRGAITTSLAEDLVGDDYTVAYEPYKNGSTKTSAAATQGYTDLNLYNYSVRGSNTGEKYTNKVSQVNQGLITQFPFLMEDVEKDEKDTDDMLAVATTHQQYFQLNMNADDIAVWYCLSGTGGSDGRYALYNYNGSHYNDGTNAYYIYNRGNITYSGAGHFQDEDLRPSATEAKLFVNTMVAAYRAAYVDPSIEFVNANGDSTTTQLIPSEYSESDKAQSLNSNQVFHFKLLDTNLSATKSMAVELYYEVDDPDAPTLESVGLKTTVTDNTGNTGEEDDTSDAGTSGIHVRRATLGDIYRVDNNQKVAAGASLVSEVVYRTAIPTEILTNFPEGVNQTKIYLKGITTFNKDPNNTLTASDSLTLQKLGLLRLE